jgi:hypothetical protein
MRLRATRTERHWTLADETHTGVLGRVLRLYRYTMVSNRRGRSPSRDRHAIWSLRRLGEVIGHTHQENLAVDRAILPALLPARVQ